MGETSYQWGGVFQAWCDYFYNIHQGLISLSSVFLCCCFPCLVALLLCSLGQRTTHLAWDFSHGCLDVLGIAILASATCFMLSILFFTSHQQPSRGSFLFQASLADSFCHRMCRTMLEEGFLATERGYHVFQLISIFALPASLPW
jgi:hypothetical protein